MMDVLREILLPKLEGIRKSGGSWMARCPAHDDCNGQPAITDGKDQPVVLKCHAGCDPEDILAKIGLTWETLCSPRDEHRPRGEWTPHGEAVAVYDYTDEDGKLLFQVLRTADKQFPQRVPDRTRKSGWRWRLGRYAPRPVPAAEGHRGSQGRRDRSRSPRARRTSTRSSAPA